MKLANGTRVVGALVTVLTAGTLAAGTAGAAPATGNLLKNGGFEAGRFTGWTRVSPVDFCPGTTAVWRVLTSPSTSWCYRKFDPNWPGSISATQKSHFADVTWDGATGEATLSQKVVIPRAKQVTLTWSDNTSWDTTYGATLPRIEYLDILNRHGSILHSYKIHALPPHTRGATGWVSRKLTLSRYAAQRVQIRFRLTIPESTTGPANFALDAVSLRTS